MRLDSSRKAGSMCESRMQVERSRGPSLLAAYTAALLNVSLCVCVYEVCVHAYMLAQSCIDM